MKKLKLIVLPVLVLALVLAGCDSSSGGGGGGEDAGQQYSVTAANFDEVFREIRETPGTYTLNLTGDLLDYPGISLNTLGVKIFVKGTGTNQITWKWDTNYQCPLFWVGSGELVIENIKLSRAQGNTQDWSLIGTEGGTLEIRNGVVVSSGAVNNGVWINGGTFKMTGGEISNCADLGVGVENGSFIMSGGVIQNNNIGIWTAENDKGITISGGTIRNNKNHALMIFSKGITINISGGTISDNGNMGIGIFDDCENVNLSLSGVTITNNGTFGVMLKGTGNTITMNSGTISGNTGFGVLIEGKNNTLAMKGGTISKHINQWGFVMQGANSSFRKTGGTIYGMDAGDNSNSYGAINVYFGGSSSLSLYGNAEGSEVYAATINSAGNGIVAGSLEGDGWEE